jgi:hypothetical protein
MSSKTCFKCLQCKPLDAFYRHAMMSDGRLGKCIECTKADVTQNRLAKIEFYRSYDRMRASVPHRAAARSAYATTPEGRLAKARAAKRWSVVHAIKRRAQNATRRAISTGRIAPLPCFECGSNAVQAHHADYSAPLAVTWLCTAHHSQLHKEHREYLRASVWPTQSEFVCGD